MQQILRKMGALFAGLRRREPAFRFGSGGCDWLPPVLGPGDWSSATMASMADSSAAWFFDRLKPPER
jgi:hypothetical protein